jgi:hypothetical protein
MSQLVDAIHKKSLPALWRQLRQCGRKSLQPTRCVSLRFRVYFGPVNRPQCRFLPEGLLRHGLATVGVDFEVCRRREQDRSRLLPRLGIAAALAEFEPDILDDVFGSTAPTASF